jgi:hypothetical protein
MEIKYLLDKKNEYKNIDNKIIEYINNIFNESNIFFKKNKKIKKNYNILKNKSLQNKKKLIENKTNLLLNKLSKNNINTILKEFIENISIITYDEYNKILNAFYIKIINEIQFIDIYLNLFMKIIIIYYKKFKYEPIQFINIIENNITNNYLSNDNSSKKNENNRINNIILIKYLINMKILNGNLKNLISSILLNQDNYIPDIYHWFLNTTISNTELSKIKNMINLDKLNFRNKVLLKELINKINIPIIINKKITIPIINNSNNDKKKNYENNHFETEITNIYEEYLYIKLIDEVKEYIKEECTSAKKKNIFCKYGIIIYFKVDNEKSKTIINLLEKLISDRILFKSNLSRGFNYIENKNKLNKGKTINFLKFLKKSGITRGLENIMGKYNLLK